MYFRQHIVDGSDNVDKTVNCIIRVVTNIEQVKYVF